MRLWQGVALTIVIVALAAACWVIREVSAQQNVQGGAIAVAQPPPVFNHLCLAFLPDLPVNHPLSRLLLAVQRFPLLHRLISQLLQTPISFTLSGATCCFSLMPKH